jgi:elongation factor G
LLGEKKGEQSHLKFLAGRRGVIEEVRAEGKNRSATAIVPLKEMIGYSALFRQKTAGKGEYSLAFEKYVPVRD